MSSGGIRGVSSGGMWGVSSGGMLSICVFSSAVIDIFQMREVCLGLETPLRLDGTMMADMRGVEDTL